MCGRYALALRPAQVRQMLEDEDMPVYEAPEDEGSSAPRQSYNFAPGYNGIIYRADVPDHGAGPVREHRVSKKRKAEAEAEETAPPPSASQSTAHHDPSHFVLQSMKWGLIPFWTKRSPDYGSMLKTINCRDDSLATPGGMWNTMKARKRCVVVAQGFYEWLKPSPKERIPHYVKRKDGKLMFFAGLWDCVSYEGEEEKLYTYSIITTDSNPQLRFLHDRMPVILDPGSEDLRMWLDPGRYEWSQELQAVLRPFTGELECYPVSKEVGKVGNNSSAFVVPVASKENKSNIANFFAKGMEKGKGKGKEIGGDVEVEKDGKKEMESVDEVVKDAEDEGVKTIEPMVGLKRKAPSPTEEEQPSAKKGAFTISPTKTKSPSPVMQKVKGKISATTNPGKSPAKRKKAGHLVKTEPGSQKITKFFGNSA